MSSPPTAPSPRPLLHGAALLLDDRAAVAQVLVSQLPDRALLEELETALSRPVLLSLASEETIAAVDAGLDAVARLLDAAEEAGADALLLAPGFAALAVLPSGSRAPLSVSDLPGAWTPQLRSSSSGARWRLSCRSGSLMVARRLLKVLPDASQLHLPAALLEAVDRPSGRLALVGGFGSGRSLLLYALLERALQQRGRHGLLVTDQVEYPLRPRGSVLEILPASSPDSLLRRSPVPDVLALDATDPVPDVQLLRSPLVLVVSEEPVEGFSTVPLSRTSSGVQVGVPVPPG